MLPGLPPGNCFSVSSTPRLNAFSYWVFLCGGLLLNSSFIFGGAPTAGWFGYANLTELPYNHVTHGIDFWILGLQILGVASMLASPG